MAIPVPNGVCSAVIDLSHDWTYADGPEAVAGPEWTDADLLKHWGDLYGWDLQKA